MLLLQHTTTSMSLLMAPSFEVPLADLAKHPAATEAPSTTTWCIERLGQELEALSILMSCIMRQRVMRASCSLLRLLPLLLGGLQEGAGGLSSCCGLAGGPEVQAARHDLGSGVTSPWCSLGWEVEDRQNSSLGEG